jgi:hypothetical protein
MRAETGAPTIAFGPHGAVEAEEDDDSDVKVKESIDLDFVPDIVAGDGDVVAEIGGAPMRACTHRDTRRTTCASASSQSAPCSPATT